jgi:hypothetical protein
MKKILIIVGGLYLAFLVFNWYFSNITGGGPKKWSWFPWGTKRGIPHPPGAEN